MRRPRNRGWIGDVWRGVRNRFLARAAIVCDFSSHLFCFLCCRKRGIFFFSHSLSTTTTTNGAHNRLLFYLNPWWICVWQPMNGIICSNALYRVANTNMFVYVSSTCSCVVLSERRNKYKKQHHCRRMEVRWLLCWQSFSATARQSINITDH